MALALDLGALSSRLKREKAQSGDITASLIWNDPSDLDLYCDIKQASGKTETIAYFHKKACNGHLDVDMNVDDSGKRFSLQPVENIYFKSPPGGDYHIYVMNAGTKTDPARWTRPEWKNDRRLVPFKCFLNKDGKMQTFQGKVKDCGKVSCFKFKIKGSGGTGGGGNYIVFPPESKQTTFKDLCAKHKIIWKIGGGFYAVARTEKIHSYKEMLLQDVKKDKFVVGQDNCRKALGWPAGELKKGPKDIKEGHRLFVQSTSANRVIPPGTHVLFEVSAEEHKRLRKAKNTKFDEETHTMGTKGMSAAAKAKAKAKAKGTGRAASPAPKAKAGAKRAASPSAPAPKAKAAARGGGASLSGKSLVFTGTLATPRAAATAAAKAAGASVLGAVSGTCDILVAGPGAGSKLSKAQALGIAIWDEAKFRKAAGL